MLSTWCPDKVNAPHFGSPVSVCSVCACLWHDWAPGGELILHLVVPGWNDFVYLLRSPVKYSLKLLLSII